MYLIFLFCLCDSRHGACGTAFSGLSIPGHTTIMLQAQNEEPVGVLMWGSTDLKLGESSAWGSVCECNPLTSYSGGDAGEKYTAFVRN
jgi:hypothetical protein